MLSFCLAHPLISILKTILSQLEIGTIHIMMSSTKGVKAALIAFLAIFSLPQVPAVLASLPLLVHLPEDQVALVVVRYKAEDWLALAQWKRLRGMCWAAEC